MGFMERVGKIAGAGIDVVSANVGMVSDMATAPFKDDEIDGFWNTVGHTVLKRGGESINAMVGKEGIVAETVGAVPKPVREGGNSVVDALEWAYREIVSQPLSMMLTAGSLRAQKLQDGDISGALEWDINEEAYGIAAKRSPGQSLALLVQGTDIEDPEELKRAAGTDTYKYLSGTTDALARIFLDPTIIGGKFAKVKKASYVAKAVGEHTDEAMKLFQPKTIATAQDRNVYINSTRYDNWSQEIDGMASTEIRDKYFKGHDQGAIVSSLYGDVNKLDEAERPRARRNVTLALMGDIAAKRELSEQSHVLRRQLDRLQGEKDVMIGLGDRGFDIANSPARLASIEDELADVEKLVGNKPDLLDFAASAGGSVLRTAPGQLGTVDRAKHAITGSNFYKGTPPGPDAKIRGVIYQYNPLTAVVRKANTWKPGGQAGYVNLHDPNSDREFDRFLQKSTIDDETKDLWRQEYMAATDDVSRMGAWQKAETAAITKFAADAGLDKDDLENLVKTAYQGRTHAQRATVSGRVYDGEGKSKVRFADDEEGTVVDLPLMVSQNQNVWMARDLDAVKQVIDRMGGYRERYKMLDKAMQIPPHVLDRYNQLWKPATLFRLGWPIRVVLDEQFRILAKIGVMAQASNLKTAFGNRISDTVHQVPQELRVPGSRKFEYKGYQLAAALGGKPGEGANIFRALNDASAAFDNMYGRGEAKALSALRGTSEEAAGTPGRDWRTFRAGVGEDVEYERSWEHDVNKQIGQDEMARKFLQNESVEDVTKWLKSTKEGRAYAKRNKFRSRQPERWAADVEDHVARYTGGSDEIKQLALENKATAKDLARIIQDPAERPVVHGQALAQAMGTGPLWDAFGAIAEKGYKYLGSAPSNFLSRNPMFDHMYRAEMQRMIDLDGRTTLTQIELDDMANVARNYALKETKGLLYDLAEQSDLEQMVRFWMPFYGAWQEVITRWAGLAVENPTWVARARQVWNSPEKAGIVTDEKGNTVNSDGVATTPDGIEVKPGKERYINVTVPEWARLPWMGDKEKMRFNKKSLNMVTSGPPGWGPLAQLPVNEIAKHNPSMEESLKWFLPFGSTQNASYDILLPTIAKRVNEVLDDDNKVHTNNAAMIWQDKMIAIETGKEQMPEGGAQALWDESMDEARDLSKLRLVSQLTMPFQAQYTSPFQMYRDIYRQARERQVKEPNAYGTHKDGSPISVDEWFYDTHRDYFAVSASITKSMNGVPPTLQGHAASKEFEDLIEKYPELGGLIAGNDGAGKFSNAVYDMQMVTKLGDGSNDNQRRVMSGKEFVQSYDQKRGWLEYNKLMDLLEAERGRRGLKNFKVKGARDLAAIKKAAVNKLGQQFPGWEQDYQSWDSGKQAKRIEGMRAIVANDKLAGRDEIDGLSQYLSARDAISAELAGRKRKSLESNPDLDLVWTNIKQGLITRNVSFQQLYYRFLEADTPTAAEVA